MRMVSDVKPGFLNLEINSRPSALTIWNTDCLWIRNLIPERSPMSARRAVGLH